MDASTFMMNGGTLSTHVIHWTRARCNPLLHNEAIHNATANNVNRQMLLFFSLEEDPRSERTLPGFGEF